MKCDGLKAFNMPRYAGEFTIYEVYLKDEVDAAIAELKEKLAEKESENRKLKRALWLARAESAKNTKCRYYRLAQKEECDPQPHGWSCYINGEVYPTGKMGRKLEPYYWFDVWEEVERKCQAKAEEYK